ncbi:MAG: DUF4293 family protein [Bacteroidetes bacterium]|nr:DUF4293 family protein [Bacteroidota bacterium]
MIQRLQSIYFIAIIIIGAVLCGGSIVNVHQDVNGVSTDYVLNIIYFNVTENNIIVAEKSSIQFALITLMAMLLAWTIKVLFSFKNRNLQIKYARFNFVFMFLLLAATFSTAALKIPGFNMSSLSFPSIFGIALMIFMFYLNWRAIMLIKHDEELVKSADRIR